MIIDLEIISQPLSGEFEERIFDSESPWNSHFWTWVKFLTDDYTECCGQFRGAPREVAISKIYNKILILTSDYIYLLDVQNADVLETLYFPQYINMTVAPSGEFILSDYYKIDVIRNNISKPETLNCPLAFGMDEIRFIEWRDNKFIFTCEEFANWNRKVEMEINTVDWKINILRELS